MTWLEIANGCHSSYKRNDLGWLLYGLVRAYKPLTCVELGVLEGYSTIFIAAALRDEMIGNLEAYDLWEDYPYRHTTMGRTQARLDEAGVAGYVTLFHADTKDVPIRYEEGKIDFLHVDVSNNGETLRWALKEFKPLLSNTSVVVFEGGSVERDQCDWMVQYDRMPIHNVLQNERLMGNWDWFVFEPYPSMTILRPQCW